jgi:hypothetical protein
MTDHTPATTAGFGTVSPDLLREVIAARAGWVNLATGALARDRWVTGAWLAGSMGCGASQRSVSSSPPALRHCARRPRQHSQRSTGYSTSYPF